MAEAYIIKSGGGSGGIAVQNTQPANNQGYVLWVNTSNNTLLYWNGSSWVQVVGVWG